MKNIYVICTLICLAFLFSCKKDQKKEPEKVEDGGCCPELGPVIVPPTETPVQDYPVVPTQVDTEKKEATPAPQYKPPGKPPKGNFVYRYTKPNKTVACKTLIQKKNPYRGTSPQDETFAYAYAKGDHAVAIAIAKRKRNK